MNNKRLGNRYVLLEKIGSGGMAVVYKATDAILNRTVAIKLLRSEFSHDPEFVKNFENEAQSAASLSHPNVVSIFDVGKEKDDHYIVMEYIDGKTLKEVIQERAPLPTAEVIEISKQISEALDHAHQHGIIHRDIKPHNILINKFGRIKVTDFGIARAVTTSTLTYQTESVLGSVHYFSPEQARGGVSTEKSDIYSLGVVMYEMLTNKLPFSGDSPISVALKHLQDEITEPSIHNQNIPDNLENLVLRTLAKDPLHRYPSAEKLLKDLKHVLDPKYSIEKLSTIVEQGEPTRVIPVIKETTPRRNRNDIQNNTANAEDVSSQLQEEHKSIIDHTGFRIGVAVFFVALLVFVSLYVYRSFTDILYVPEARVPVVEGELLSEAILKFEELGFEASNIVEEYRYDQEVPEGHIIRQDPVGNSRVKVNYSPLTLFISKGKERTTIPNVIGNTASRAKFLLEQQGLQVEVIEEFNEKVNSGEVFNQVPSAGEEVIPGDTAVTIHVSKGLESFKMPNLITLSLAEAEKQLQVNGLVRGTIFQEPSYVVQRGEVIRQAPVKADDAVTKGQIIDLWISSGYPADARYYEEAIFVRPTQIGTKSDVVIKVSDARGKAQVFYQRTIVDEELFNVQLVLAPQTIGVIEVYLNGVFVDSKAVSY
ncbi:Stk1 family PASTA domain-containing Ser/Thr kinase [Desulfuribacillus stibiiarsenatis]|uniref:Stk1 family PASTA domain-containing Ser/Thr kinase n=1 Tax=Desulfuribacillus stibiiarsenatis TaxID=1390249 RepID=UPI0009F642F0|nr:Stk1 family PASTA domain-containing Ser/Thr kinase [Desulfuribacillus stibiiarsenatis]